MPSSVLDIGNISLDDLKVGGVYYSITYMDDAMHDPVIRTFVYVGLSESGNLRFQDVMSYRAGVVFENADEIEEDCPVELYECESGETSAIFEFDNALRAILRCADRRRTKLPDC